jgi:RNA polymerase sigma factor (sigma-70 family)
MNWPEVPDKELVALCLQRNQDAWLELLRRYEHRMGNVVGKSLRKWTRPHPELVEDLVQETLKKVTANECRALREFQWLHDHSLSGFLMKVASNAAADYRRRQLAPAHDQNKEVALDQPGLPPQADSSNFAKTDHRILLEELARCLEKLIRTEVDRTRDIAMFLLYFGQSVTASDLARVYQLSIKAVENTLARLARIARAKCLRSTWATQKT